MYHFKLHRVSLHTVVTSWMYSRACTIHSDKLLIWLLFKNLVRSSEFMNMGFEVTRYWDNVSNRIFISLICLNFYHKIKHIRPSGKPSCWKKVSFIRGPLLITTITSWSSIEIEYKSFHIFLHKELYGDLKVQANTCGHMVIFAMESTSLGSF